MADGKRRIAMPSMRRVVICAMMAGMSAFAAGAQAATLYTYSFTQDGYFSSARPDQDITAVLSGSFSFAGPSPTGIVGKADLVDFAYSFTTYFAGQPVPVDHGDLSNLVSFSYHPGQDGSFLLQTHTDMHEICVGAAASFGLCGLPTGFNGSYAIFASGETPDASFLVTWAGAKLTLTSPIIAPPVAATPIPPALPLFASCLGAFGFLGWQGTRSRQRGRDRSRPPGRPIGSALA